MKCSNLIDEDNVGLSGQYASSDCIVDQGVLAGSSSVTLAISHFKDGH